MITKIDVNIGSYLRELKISEELATKIFEFSHLFFCGFKSNILTPPPALNEVCETSSLNHLYSLEDLVTMRSNYYYPYRCIHWYVMIPSFEQMDSLLNKYKDLEIFI